MRATIFLLALCASSPAIAAAKVNRLPAMPTPIDFSRPANAACEMRIERDYYLRPLSFRQEVLLQYIPPIAHDFNQCVQNRRLHNNSF